MSVMIEIQSQMSQALKKRKERKTVVLSFPVELKIWERNYSQISKMKDI